MKSWAWEFFCLALFLCLAGWQLFFPPVTGLSDNNDFPKVLGPANICKAPFENVNTYFVSSYDAGPKCEWPSGFTSSEILFFKAARFLSRPFTGRNHFDIRASAALHLAILGIAMALFLNLTRRGGKSLRFLLPPLAILMFTDVAYIAFLNSAYMDNASWVLFLLLVTIAATVCADPGPKWLAPAYGVAGVLLVCSKAQHAPVGIPFAILAGYFAWRNRPARPVWSGVAVILLASAAIMPSTTPPEYRTISLYNLIFFRLSPTDKTILGQLGLDAGYQANIGTNAFDAASHMGDANWRREFESRVSFGTVASLYLRRPGVAFRELDHELHDSAHLLRPTYMANYRQEDGFPPHSVATRFTLWSSFKMAAIERFPWCLVALYVLPLMAIYRSRGRRALPLLAVALAVTGLGEFTLCTLADGIDTNRHLFLFQVITDALLLLVLPCLGCAGAKLP